MFSFATNRAGLVAIFIQFVVGDLINVLSASSVTKTDIENGFNMVGWKLAIVAFGGFVTNFMKEFFFTLAGERIGQRLKELYFSAITEQEMAFFDIKKIGSLTIVLSDGVSKVQEAYTDKASTLVRDITTTIGGFIMSVISAYRMTLIIASTTPLLLLTILVLSFFFRYFTLKNNDINSKAMAMANEVVSSIKIIRSMSGELKEQDKYKKQISRVHLYGFLRAFVLGVAFLVVSFIVWGTISLGLWCGGYDVIDGVITVGDYFKVCGLMTASVFALVQTIAFFPEFTKALLNESVVLKVLKRKPEIQFKGGRVFDDLKGNISFKNVDFIYPARPNTVVLNNFSLDIQQGQSVALVGPSGSGKSTIVGLVERFYNPTAGQIFIDGIDILEIDPMFIHKKVGIVTQEPVLFSASIKENIAYAVGLENTNEDQIIEAAKLANCHNFIMDLPDGYGTILGEKGVSMSGGQKQRIAIARALVQNPVVLILDEATSALDTESESLVQVALDNLMKGRTTISIAHRLSTIVNYDMICVLVKGELVEKGKHNELLAIKNGIYRKLADKQMTFKPESSQIDENSCIVEDYYNDDIEYVIYI